MEENAVELFDYLRVIWKRKIIIIVVILVGLGIGVGVKVMNVKPKLENQVKYRADAVIRIGKKVRIMSASGISYSTSIVEYIESPGNMVESIPHTYSLKLSDFPRYRFEVKQVGSLSMIKLTLEGPDKGVEKILKELVDMLIAEHLVRAKDAVVEYENFMKMLERDAEKLKEEIVVLTAGIKNMKEKEGEHLIHIDSETKGIVPDEKIGDRSAFLNMLYLKTIDKENKLSSIRTNLREIQMQLIMHRITLGNLEEYKTEMVGVITNTVMAAPAAAVKSNTIAVAGVAGLIMSLFIAFFIEYIEESKLRRKGK